MIILRIYSNKLRVGKDKNIKNNLFLLLSTETVIFSGFLRPLLSQSDEFAISSVHSHCLESRRFLLLVGYFSGFGIVVNLFNWNNRSSQLGGNINFSLCAISLLRLAGLNRIMKVISVIFKYNHSLSNFPFNSNLRIITLLLEKTSERWSLLAPFSRPGLVKFNKIYIEKVN